LIARRLGNGDPRPDIISEVRKREIARAASGSLANVLS
jgi:hypothetical protein